MVTPVSSLSSQAMAPAPAPVATVALACSCDQLQRAQQRLLALASQCGERMDRLQQAFDRLPATAAFDPFAVAAAAPSARTTTPAAPAPRVKGQARMPASAPAPASTSAGALGRVGAAALPSRPMPRAVTDDDGTGIAGALAGAAAGRASAPSGKVAASLNGWLGALGDLAALGGEQVALLMQRHAAPSLTMGLGGAVAAALAGDGDRGQPADALQRRRGGTGARGGSLGSFGAQALQAAEPAHAAGAAQRSSMALGQELASGLSAAFAAAGWPETQAMPARLARTASQAMATAPQLLEQLLAQGLGNALAGAPGASDQPTRAARQPAPRAASRLVGAQTSAAGNDARAQAPDAPAAASLDALDAGEAVAQQISRLLLDQAWMRGVDLR